MSSILKEQYIRIIYTVFFVLLCIVNNVVGSQTGRVQFIAISAAGTVIGFLIISSYNYIDFAKPIFFVWLGLFFPLWIIGFFWSKKNYPYLGVWIINTFNIGLYGLIVIRLIKGMVIERNVKTKLKVPLLLWIIMQTIMIISPTHDKWTLGYFVIYLLLYLTDFDEKKRNILVDSIIDGIMYGFVLIQGAAFLFRPYDTVRYRGFFSNPNMNALFYLIVYSAIVTKWCDSIINNRNKKKILFGFFSSMMYGLVFMTGSKTAIMVIIFETIVFLAVICVAKGEKKIKTTISLLLKYTSFIVLIAIISVPIMYFMVRYLPTMHLHPIYFEGEWSEAKIQPGEDRNSVKYVPFVKMVKKNTGRLLWFIELDEEEQEEEVKEKKIINKEYYLEEDNLDQIDPIKLRTVIFLHYIRKLNLQGHSDDEEGVPLTKYYTVPHAHNWLLQMSFRYGMLVGLLYMFMVIQYVIYVYRTIKGEKYKLACLIACIVSSFLLFGLFEITWGAGQIHFLLFYFLYYFVITKKEKEEEN